jgi:hypothetical protein
MRFPLFFFTVLGVLSVFYSTARAVTVDEAVRVEGNYIRIQASPVDGGALRELGWAHPRRSCSA